MAGCRSFFSIPMNLHRNGSTLGEKVSESFSVSSSECPLLAMDSDKQYLTVTISAFA